MTWTEPTGCRKAAPKMVLTGSAATAIGMTVAAARVALGP